MPDNVNPDVELDLNEGAVVVDENANSDSLSPHGGTAGPGDSKAAKIAGIVLNLTKLSDDDLNGFKASLAQIGKEAEGIGAGNAANNKSSIAAKPSAASTKGMVKEELTALFGEAEGLSEGFIDQATTLFEAAVTTRVALEVVDLNEQLETQLAEQTESMVSEFAERLDTYLDYISEKWLDDNKIAVEAGIKTELTEGFLTGLRDLFAEHYVTVPEDKVDVVEALSAQLEELQNQLNEQINENIALTSSTEKVALGAVVAEAAEGLTDADADRLATLSEDLDFDTVDEFRSKVNLLKENFFAGTPAAAGSNGLLIEEVGLVEDEEVAPTPVNTRMDAYSKAISRDVRK